MRRRAPRGRSTPAGPRRASPRRRQTRRRPGRGGLRWALLLLITGAAFWALCRPEHFPRLGERHPDLIVIHHSATPPRVGGRLIDAAAIDAMHACRGFQVLYNGKTYHIGYHYVVLQDGTVEHGRPEDVRGAHARHENSHSLGICLVGDFDRGDNPHGEKGPLQPTPAQMRSLVRLCADLERRYHIPVRNVLRHRDVGQTACPGDRFPLAAFRSALRRELGAAEPEAGALQEAWWQDLWRRLRGAG